MNKRIKKKLQKRLGYMRYANYRISQTPIKFILRGEPVDQEIMVPCSVLLQTAGKPNKNKRVYSEPFLMKAMDDCIKKDKFTRYQVCW